MNVTIAFALASLATLASAELPAQTMADVRTGARIRVEVPRGKKSEQLVGVLVSRSPEGLQLELDRSHEVVNIPFDQARKVEVSLERHSAAGRTALGGFLLGASFGMGAGLSCDCGRPGLAGLTFAAILGGLGTGIGALAGMGGRVDKWSPVLSPATRERMRTELQPGGITLLQLQF